MTEVVCEICGNETGVGMSTCPWCGEECTTPASVLPDARHRLINLEKGMPTVEQALKRLAVELESACLHGYRVLTLIHGYGSSGKGGKIKKAIRHRLDYELHHGIVNTVVTGEEFSRGSGVGKHLLRRFPFLSTHPGLNRQNPGITIVVLDKKQ